jgi:hypothetical protein
VHRGDIVALFLRPDAAGDTAQPEEGTVTDKRKQHYTGDDEIIERNMERSREVIEGRKREHDDDDNRAPIDAEMSAPENARDDLRDVPIGGQSNPNARGGTAKRHKSG